MLSLSDPVFACTRSSLLAQCKDTNSSAKMILDQNITNEEQTAGVTKKVKVQGKCFNLVKIQNVPAMSHRITILRKSGQ